MQQLQQSIEQPSLKARFDAICLDYSIVESETSQAAKKLQYLGQNVKPKLFKEMEAIKKEIQLSLDL
ncbi:hypothetical protein [Acinetobacter sp. B51(2017)]|uniref:hypothetical protein n=1 Tax=Acinetobacter sp. B51(2017) TaxID=2060938 RepID=UPI000F079BAD|nr:hypothetical protein [Acinetobacter sp. B51(2017)]